MKKTEIHPTETNANMKIKDSIIWKIEIYPPKLILM